MDVNELIDKSICFDEVYRKKHFLQLLDVNVNREMYKILNLFMYKIVHY